MSREVDAIRVMDETLPQFDASTRARMLTFFWDKHVLQPQRDNERLRAELPRVNKRLRKVVRDLRAGRTTVDPFPSVASAEMTEQERSPG